MRRFLPTVGAVLLFLVLVFVGFSVRRHDIRAQASRHELCVQIQQLKTQIVQSLERSEKGLPENAYYKTRPGELAKALRDVRHEIKRFQPTDC